MKSSIILVLLIISSCTMPESYLKNSELQTNEYYDVIYEGNTIWVVPKDSASLSQYAKMKYTMVKLRKGYALKSIYIYDSLNQLIDTEYNPAIAIYKYSFLKGTERKLMYFDKNKALAEPMFTNAAIIKSKYKYNYRKTRISETRYFTKDKKPRCGDAGFIICTQWDSIPIIYDSTQHTLPKEYYDSTQYVYQFKTLYTLDCNKNKINN